VAGKELEIQGVQEVLFHLDGKKFSHQFCVCSLPTDADGTIGMDFLAEENAHLNLEKSQLRLSGTKCNKGFENQRTRQAKGKASHGALTVFLRRNGDCRREEPVAKVRKVEEMREQEFKLLPLAVEVLEGKSWIVKTTETIKLAPRVKQIIVGKLKMPKRRESPELVKVFSSTRTLPNIYEVTAVD
jgi:hypothetical protein